MRQSTGIEWRVRWFAQPPVKYLQGLFGLIEVRLRAGINAPWQQLRE